MKKVFILAVLFMLSQSYVFAIELVAIDKGSGTIIHKVPVADKNIGNLYKYFVQCTNGKKYYTSDRHIWKGTGYYYNVVRGSKKICQVSRVNFK